MTNDEFIDALGGTGAVAELCGVTPGAVSQWRGAKIPLMHRFTLARRAVDAKIVYDPETGEARKVAA